MSDSNDGSEIDDYGISSHNTTAAHERTERFSNESFAKRWIPWIVGCFLFSALVFFLIVILIVTLALTRHKYKDRVIIAKRLGKHPIIANRYFLDEHKDVSTFRYNSIPAYLQKRNTSGEIVDEDHLIYQATSLAPMPDSDYDVSASQLVSTSQVYTAHGHLVWDPVDEDSVLVKPGLQSPRGVRQPRVVFSEAREAYFMFYVSVSADEKLREHRVLTMRSLPKSEWSKGNYEPDAWSDETIVLPHVRDMSAAVMLHQSNDTNTYLYFGDYPEIRIAKAVDTSLTEWKELPAKHEQNILLKPRNGELGTKRSFDSHSISPGPVPLQLSDKQGGHYLFLYNSRQIIPSLDQYNGRPFWSFRGEVGYAIIDKHDNTKVLERSSVPLLTPELDWERCDYTTKSQFHTGSVTGYEPNTIQVAGWKRIGSHDSDRFMVYYSGCGSYIGRAEIEVKWRT